MREITIRSVAKVLYDLYGDSKDIFYAAEWEDGALAVIEATLAHESATSIPPPDYSEPLTSKTK